ncbi:MAG: single-stranded-DNA-specific exonuclease RecJ [Proteobacteria bacterium]|nr:MAG: single-stranded-DNA-specific exonuclease RecJ [Pseudomonadota bacterium]PIE67289.1 MAG: single-stranded-DNA-specific exonuclease RecJ [Deltaproteobacteria bacterium]
MEKQWQLLDPDPKIVAALSRQLNCSPLMARLLVIRGIQTADRATRFLNPTFSSLTPPFELAGMRSAVRRIYHALSTDQRLLVCGDYDADGITATVVLIHFLRQCDARVSYYIPHRIQDGYGLTTDLLTSRILPKQVDLIITTDCGSGSHEAISLARQAGVDTIVTDHHPVDEPPADAVAVINPAQPGCRANLAHLAGVGVAFYLVIALRTYLREKGFWKDRPEPNLTQFCDLVAIGTVADIVPLIAENRTFVHAGLHRINRGERRGIEALLRTGRSSSAPVDAQTIAFRLAPQINAAGRLVHARMACELLLADEHDKTHRLAGTLASLNSRRQRMEKELLASILDTMPHPPDGSYPSVLVMDGANWHEGILGIVASRLARQFYRPAVVLSNRNGTAKGSARSVEGIDLTVAMAQCADLLDRFGGHPMAAGLALQTARIAEFRARLVAVVDRMLEKQVPVETLTIDAHVPLDRVTPFLMDELNRIGPFGQANPQPLFTASDIRIHACRIVGGRHRQLVMHKASDGNGLYRGIQFNADRVLAKGDHIDKIAYRPQWNYWKGKKELQFLIEAVEPDI